MVRPQRLALFESLSFLLLENPTGNPTLAVAGVGAVRAHAALLLRVHGRAATVPAAAPGGLAFPVSTAGQTGTRGFAIDATHRFLGLRNKKQTNLAQPSL